MSERTDPRTVEDLPAGVEIARVRVLDTVWSVVDHASGVQEDIAAMWARCATTDAVDREYHLVPEGVLPPPDLEHAVANSEQAGYRLASTLIATSIGDHAGCSIMLHGGALTSPGSDRALALVAASGTGKTTASKVLAQLGWGYLTDECVAVGEDLVVRPLEKPLSIVTDPAAPHAKHQLGPDALEMARPAQPAQLAGIVLLHRIRQDDDPQAAGELPRLEPVDLLEALGALAPQTSALPRTPGGLGRLADLVQRVGVHRLVYREIDQCGDLLTSVVQGEHPWPAPDAVDVRQGGMVANATPPLPGAQEPLPRDVHWRTADFTTAVVVDEQDVLVMSGFAVNHLGPVAAAVWLALAEPHTEAQAVTAMTQAFGDHPQAADLVHDVLAHLWRAGLVEPT